MYRFHKTVEIKTSTALTVVVVFALLCGTFVITYSNRVVQGLELGVQTREIS